MLLAGWSVQPRSALYGTHEDLHVLGLPMPGCSFMIRYGYPCPACGLTTSVSAMAHGRLMTAIAAQPFGTVLAIAAAALGCMGTVELARGVDVIGRLRPRIWWLWLGVGGVLAGWIVKLLVGVLNGTFPTH